jgi:photosystem II stability/assembly factor-like uncharacterized protein
MIPLLASAVVALVWQAAALPSIQSCRSGDRGPCRTPEPFTYLPAPPYPSPLVVANFGLIVPAPTGGAWQFLCDDLYDLAPADRVWRSPVGRLLAAGRGGLQLSDDGGCTWLAARGDLASQEVLDLAIDAGTPTRLWALAGGALHRSLDGGQTFARQRPLPAGLMLPRLRSAPSQGGLLYLVGSTVGATTWLERSSDGGETWTGRELTAGLQPPLRNPLALVAVAPDDPAALYFVVVDQDGDELWKSADGGQSVQRVLELREGEVLGGLTFGASGDILFVAGTAAIVVDGRPPARLYRSGDGGRSWAEPIPSPRDGPYFRCLAFSAGRLLACGVGESGGDRFLVGASSDEGRTWTPAVRLADVEGPRACARNRCVATEQWLCDSYGRCGDPPDAGADAVDARVAESPPRHAGCGCVTGMSYQERSGGGPLLAIAALIGVAVRRWSRLSRNRTR